MKKAKLPPPTIDADTAAKVLQADLGNLLKRVQAGQPLTRAQRALIEQAANPTQAPQATDGDDGEDRSKPPRSPAELARRLGVSRQRVAAWQSRPDAPPVDDVRAWRHYLATFARVPLATPDPSERAAAPGEQNPTPRLWLCDGCYMVLDKLGHDLPATLTTLCAQAGLAPTQAQVDALAVGLFAAVACETNAALVGWQQEPFEPEDFPRTIRDAAGRIA